MTKKKAQVVKQKVIYVGYEISAGQRTLGKERIESICQTPRPQTTKELRTLLGMTGWCRLGIYNYGLLVKPLYLLIANGSRDLQWTKEATQAFGQLEKALMSAPALGLPDWVPIHHDCLETIEATYSICSDLKDTPLDDAETWFTDGRSYVINGKRHIQRLNRIRTITCSCIQAQIWMQSTAALTIREGSEGAFPMEIRKSVWDNATDFEKKFQSWWASVNFTYDPIANMATALVLTVHNATVHVIHPITALGLNDERSVLYPSEHRT
ncbi:hypothetical protein DUI87_11178 [Hirundo rustica rustica]|uniref:Reverse transcriptase/retrotransposon-derived protein RNase H-like domain-containing protein n=1 Tax=Hirundo rustica rustica TaxID=333673 RepID=A0A3M0KG69_HIRRU|nr:hypothetical protein DUI87_11178 [Hirundo rustica rustica]